MSGHSYWGSWSSLGQGTLHNISRRRWLQEIWCFLLMPLAMKASNIGDFRESFLALVLHLLKTDVATDPS